MVPLRVPEILPANSGTPQCGSHRGVISRERRQGAQLLVAAACSFDTFIGNELCDLICS
jgi:hypothetical protein